MISSSVSANFEISSSLLKFPRSGFVSLDSALSLSIVLFNRNSKNVMIRGMRHYVADTQTDRKTRRIMNVLDTWTPKALALILSKPSTSYSSKA